MLKHGELRRLAMLRLADATALYECARFDAAVYMCGYALELALKACICKRLRLRDYPEAALNGRFKTHNLEDLVLLAGLRESITPANSVLFENWSAATKWTPEWR